MRWGGLNPLAVLAAAISIYAIGFLIYGVLFSEQWMALAGFTEADFAGEEWRMALGPIMPLLTALALAVLIKWAGADTLRDGLRIGLVAWMFFFAAELYEFAYSPAPVGLLLLDSAHLLINCAAAGAILGAWPPGRWPKRA